MRPRGPAAARAAERRPLGRWVEARGSGPDGGLGARSATVGLPVSRPVSRSCRARSIVDRWLFATVRPTGPERSVGSVKDKVAWPPGPSIGRLLTALHKRSPSAVVLSPLAVAYHDFVRVTAPSGPRGAGSQVWVPIAIAWWLDSGSSGRIRVGAAQARRIPQDPIYAGPEPPGRRSGAY